jgi:hypothetical protein
MGEMIEKQETTYEKFQMAYCFAEKTDSSIRIF